MITNSSFDATKYYRQNLRDDADNYRLTQETRESDSGHRPMFNQLLGALGTLLYNMGTRLQEKFELEQSAHPIQTPVIE